jgi:hypothetical protein
MYLVLVLIAVLIVDQGRSGSGPRVANGQGIKVRLSSGEVTADTRKPQVRLMPS